MENSFYVALSRQQALMHQLEVVAHNMANTSTPSFKAERLLFREFINNPFYGESYSLVQDYGKSRDTRLGSFTHTSNPLDLAIEESGQYFALQTPQGVRYTRNGRFTLDSESNLINNQGHYLLDENETPIQVSTIGITPDLDTLFISKDGSISAPNFPQIGKIGVYTFENLQRLQKVENSFYIASEEATAVENPRIAQGLLEESNVEPMIEITKMIRLQREVEVVDDFIEKENERIKNMIDKLMSNR